MRLNFQVCPQLFVVAKQIADFRIVVGGIKLQILHIYIILFGQKQRIKNPFKRQAQLGIVALYHPLVALCNLLRTQDSALLGQAQAALPKLLSVYDQVVKEIENY